MGLIWTRSIHTTQQYVEYRVKIVRELRIKRNLDGSVPYMMELAHQSSSHRLVIGARIPKFISDFLGKFVRWAQCSKGELGHTSRPPR